MMDLVFTDERYKNNTIHPKAIIGNNVKMGKGNYIGPFCIIENGVEIGDDNYFHSHVSVGSPPEHKAPEYDPRTRKEFGKVIIGDRNTFREFFVANAPIKDLTIIGNDGYYMHNSHVGHDSSIGHGVIMSVGSVTGGHSIVCDGSYLGINAVTHPFSIIGHYAMIGMNTTITKHVSPCIKAVGSPAKSLGYNTVGMDRNNINVPTAMALKNRFMELVNANPRKEVL